MKKIVVLLMGLISIFTLSSCANMKTRTTMLDELSHYAPSKKIEILTSMPACGHKTIASWECSGCSGVIHYQCFSDLQKRAMQLGADALFIQKAGTFPCQGFCHCPYVQASAIKFKSTSNKQ